MSRKRRLLFIGLSLVLAAVVVESLSYVLLAAWEGDVHPVPAVRSRRASVLASGPSQPRRAVHQPLMPFSVLHPYLGVATREGELPEELSALEKWSAVAEVDPRELPEEGTVVVGLLGGSVALQLLLLARDDLRLGLEEQLGGDRVVLLGIAKSGQKQPQQLLAVNYLLSAGFHFDILINLDGFNEICISGANLLDQISPIYPFGWRSLTDASPSISALERIGAVAHLKGTRRRLAQFFDGVPASGSVTCNLLWTLLDEGCQRQIAKGRAERSALQEDLPFLGPEIPQDTPRALLRELAGIWRRSSLQLHHLSEANAIRYYHLLQPNQYVPESKPMQAAERSIAINKGSPYALMVPPGYAELIRQGDQLRQAGVSYFDLTPLFADELDAVYADDCCHLNERGNRLLAARIASIVAADRSPTLGR